MLDLEVIDNPSAAASALDPMRSKMLGLLVEPGSATTLSIALGVSRQQVNYHLRMLESNGLVTMIEQRPRRGLVERIMQATARSYDVSPDAIASGDTTSTDIRIDRLSARYLIALGARLVREVATLIRRSEEAGRPLATLALDSEIRFASADERARFTSDLTSCITALASKYHSESPGGRVHRLIVAAHPLPSPPTTQKEKVHD